MIVANVAMAIQARRKKVSDVIYVNNKDENE